MAYSQFENNDFKGAILNAFIEVVDQVKKKTNYPKDRNGRDVDGDDLMNKVFGCDGEQVPQIKFNALNSGLDRAEQRGLMYLFKGVVGVRDKKAHLNFIQNDPLKTIEYLGLASLLLRLLDENAKRSSRQKRKKKLGSEYNFLGSSHARARLHQRISVRVQFHARGWSLVTSLPPLRALGFAARYAAASAARPSRAE